MAKVSARVSATLKNRHALSFLLKAASTNQEKFVREYVRMMVRTAAERTPRYSGAATLGWRVTVDKGKANSHKNAPTGWGELVFEGGIYDPKSSGLINRLVGQSNFPQFDIVARMLKNGSASFYLYNLEQHSSLWLEGGAESNLRDVNRDYWTLAEITAAIRLRSKPMVKKFGGRY